MITNIIEHCIEQIIWTLPTTTNNISSEEGLDNSVNDDNNNSNEDGGGGGITAMVSSTMKILSLHQMLLMRNAKQSIDDDNNGPDLPPAVIEDISNDIDKSQKRIDSINTLTPPIPFNYAEFENDDDDVAKDKMNLKPAASTRPGASPRNH